MIGYGSEKKKHETKSRTNFNLVLVYKVREYVVCSTLVEWMRESRNQVLNQKLLKQIAQKIKNS